MEKLSVTLNGQVCRLVQKGYYVDHSVKTALLGDIFSGRNEIVVSMPFGVKTQVEWMYLLGDFGVKLTGCKRTLTAPMEKIGFGDWTYQGLTHYTGNLTYELPFVAPGGRMAVRIPHYRGGLLRLSLDGNDLGPLAYAPNRMDMGNIEAGAHTLFITCFGHRFNGFGAVHNADRSTTCHDPSAWRTTGDAWSEEYRLSEMGVLSTPIFEVAD